MAITTNQDKHLRSVVKATTWRVIATCDTIFLSWLITGQIATALKIGATEVFTKICLYYLHERIWGKAHFGRKSVLKKDGTMQITDMHYRSLIKGISWRFFGTLDTIMISLFWTGDVAKAFAIGGTEIITKVTLFWIHERVWLNVKWGRTEKKEETTPAAVVTENLVPVTEQVEAKSNS